MSQNCQFYVSVRLWTVIFFVCGTAMATHASAEADAGHYGVKPGDLLQVSVWREEDLQLEILVRPDGAISMPLVGTLIAQDKTVAQLKSEIAERLERFIPDPEVAVSVAEIRGHTIYVLGKVARPGEFVMNQDIDVMQALSIAGGTTTFAKLNHIRILRRVDGKQIAIPFHYGRVESGQELQQNIILMSGDTLVVP